MIRSTYWSLRNLKWFYFIPVIVTLIYMPFMSIFLYQSYYDSMDIYYHLMLSQFNLFLPLFSVWWTIFTLKEFIESDGNEVLYLFCGPLNILKTQLLIFSLYVLHISVFMLSFNLYFGEHYFVTLQMIISSFALSGFAYFISFAFKSTGVALLFSIVYSICLNLFDLDKTLAVISIFPETMVMNKMSLLHITLVFAFGVIMYSLGLLMSKIRLPYR